jgi:hypothetical protein
VTSWVSIENAIPARNADRCLPRESGKYAFFVMTTDRLPALFREEAMRRPDPRLLYIGKADRSLFQRVWRQECQHRSPGTFFRSVGAMLGYLSPKGGKNFEFSPEDKTAIIDWIAENLSVAWSTEPADGEHCESEKALIETFQPVLNIAGIKPGFAELKRLRAICRRGQVDVGSAFRIERSVVIPKFARA